MFIKLLFPRSEARQSRRHYGHQADSLVEHRRTAVQDNESGRSCLWRLRCVIQLQALCCRSFQQTFISGCADFPIHALFSGNGALQLTQQNCWRFELKGTRTVRSPGSVYRVSTSYSSKYREVHFGHFRSAKSSSPQFSPPRRKISS